MDCGGETPFLSLPYPIRGSNPSRARCCTQARTLRPVAREMALYEAPVGHMRCRVAFSATVHGMRRWACFSSAGSSCLARRLAVSTCTPTRFAIVCQSVCAVRREMMAASMSRLNWMINGPTPGARGWSPGKSPDQRPARTRGCRRGRGRRRGGSFAQSIARHTDWGRQQRHHVVLATATAGPRPADTAVDLHALENLRIGLPILCAVAEERRPALLRAFRHQRFPLTQPCDMTRPATSAVGDLILLGIDAKHAAHAGTALTVERIEPAALGLDVVDYLLRRPRRDRPADEPAFRRPFLVKRVLAGLTLVAAHALPDFDRREVVDQRRHVGVERHALQKKGAELRHAGREPSLHHAQVQEGVACRYE